MSLLILSWWNICRYLKCVFCSQLYIWVWVTWGEGYVNGVVCVWRRPVTQNCISERRKAREGWVTTLLVPPLAIQFCPNNSRLKYHAETFHISSLRSFWQLTSCSLLFFAMMAWVSHRAFSVTLPTAMLPAVQGSTSVPQPKLYHLVHFPLTWHCRDFKSY